METRSLTISYREYAEIDSISPEDRCLLESAVEGTKSAYAAFSGFSVGAALLLENGEIILGSNQENIAYPSSLCAERVAFYYAKSKYPNVKIKKLAVTARSSKEVVSSPITPCGACRQVMIEYERIQKGTIQVILRGQVGKVCVFNTIADILPFSFETTAV